jgi:acyl dehydratase
MNLDQMTQLVGRELGTSEWLTIGQREIDQFAQCTGDRQWIHVDAERAAREGPFGTTVAHGYLTLALLAPTSFEVWIGRLGAAAAFNYGLERVRFINPVKSGMRVRNRITLAAVERKGNGRALVTTDNAVEIEGEAKPALVATALVLVEVPS